MKTTEDLIWEWWASVELETSHDVVDIDKEDIKKMNTAIKREDIYDYDGMKLTEGDAGSIFLRIVDRLYFDIHVEHKMGRYK